MAILLIFLGIDVYFRGRGEKGEEEGEGDRKTDIGRMFHPDHNF